MIRTRRARLRAFVTLASEVIATAWPLDTFVAVNPLAGYETTTFDDATARASALFRARVLPEVAHARASATADRAREHANAIIEAIGSDNTLGDACLMLGWGDVVQRVNERLSLWLTAYCDRGEAPWPMPYRDVGFYGAWKRLARHERAFAADDRRYRAQIDALPDRADDALLAHLDALEIPEQRWIGYLQRHLAQCAGWSAYIKQLVASRDARIDLVAVLAVRMWYERQEFTARANAMGCPGTYEALRTWARENAARIPRSGAPGFDCVEHALAIKELEARERDYREHVLGKMQRPPASPVSHAGAQFVFCIDARSERLRRLLERAGHFETFGFAGFFGVPFRYRPYGASETLAQAPVLVRPSSTVGELPGEAAVRSLVGQAASSAAREALTKGALNHPLAAFAGVEAVGLFSALRSAVKTFFVNRRQDDRPPLPLDMQEIAQEERMFLAESALKIMGFTREFAAIVVICGHGGGTVNNAFGAALDCGACGGNRGLVNARVLCAILNDAAVRLGLDARGIAIPPETCFVAAEHDTTRDHVRFLCEDVPTARKAAVSELEEVVNTIAARNRMRRIAELPESPMGFGDARARAADWAQVRPEWGLARNAGFIIAPRSLTREIDLEGRCFLHSYDPGADTGGTALEQILTAPLVVAQWINMQYFFATTDPERFGSGDKVLQQPVGGFGVISGNGGDLRPGLPLQSTSVGGTPYHEALRLQAFVFAPLARIDAVIARQTVLQRLFDNRWVSLTAIDPDTGVAHYYAGKHTWLPVQRSEVVSCSQIA